MAWVFVSVSARGDPCIDVDGDRDTDLAEFQVLQLCFSGPDREPAQPCCEPFDVDGDGDVDPWDSSGFVASFTGPGRQPPLCYELEGLNFSAFVGDQDPNHGAQVDASQVRERLGRIAPYIKRVRIFSVVNGHQHVGPPAREHGLEIAAGAWIGRDVNANEIELAGLIEMAQAGYVDLAIVGSEALLRRDVSETGQSHF
jgi:hypothetical protein